MSKAHRVWMCVKGALLLVLMLALALLLALMLAGTD